MKTVCLEEHFAIQEVFHAWEGLDPRSRDMAIDASTTGEGGRRLLEIGPERIAAMDAAGIDVSVLSLTTPGVQNLAADTAVRLARASNNRAADAVRSYPDRLQAFATLPTSSPQDAARELERAVRQLGMNGAMVFGRTGERNFDHSDFWPIFEAASALRVPLYIHPQTPPNQVLEAHYTGFGKAVDSLFARAGIGWHFEAGLQILRLILAGVFDRFPDLTLITGHMGENILFYLDRIDLMSDAAKFPKKLSEYVQQHVYITPSGLYSQRYLRWAIEILGADHIMMATDYPFANTPQAIGETFLQKADLTDEQRLQIASGNWERLCAQIKR